MTSRNAIQCTFCTRWQSPFDTGTADQENPRQVCDAFPAGIPDQIWWGRADHRRPFADDNGLQWESDQGVEFPELALADVQTASGRERWAGCRYCLNPPHAGPCR